MTGYNSHDSGVLAISIDYLALSGPLSRRATHTQYFICKMLKIINY